MRSTVAQDASTTASASANARPIPGTQAITAARAHLRKVFPTVSSGMRTMFHLRRLKSAAHMAHIVNEGLPYRDAADGQLKLRTHRPQLREEGMIERRLEEGHAARAAGAALEADDALHRLHVAEAPLLKPVLQIDQLLGEFVEVEIRRRV